MKKIISIFLLVFIVWWLKEIYFHEEASIEHILGIVVKNTNATDLLKRVIEKDDLIALGTNKKMKKMIDKNAFHLSDFIEDFRMANAYEEHTLNRLGDLLSENGYNEEAVYIYEMAINDNQGNIVASLIRIGDIKNSEGRLEEFFNYCKYVIERYPNDNSLYESLADFFYTNNMPQMALALLDYGLNYNKDNATYITFYQSFSEFIQNLTPDADSDNLGSFEKDVSARHKAFLLSPV